MSSFYWVFFFRRSCARSTPKSCRSAEDIRCGTVNRGFCFDLGLLERETGTTHGDLPFEAPLNQDWIDPKRLIGKHKGKLF